MLVADINGIEFALASLEDAETLLGVLSRGKPVEYDYRLPADRCYVETGFFRRGIEIKISGSGIVTREEAEELRRQYDEKKAAQKE